MGRIINYSLEMKYKLAIPLVIISAFSVFVVNAQAITSLHNTEFSLNVLDNWAYQESGHSLQNVFGGGPWVRLIPVEFSEMLINPGQELSGTTIKNHGAYVTIGLDTAYPFRNVPLNIYTQYNLNLSEVKIFARANVTIDGEEAVRIHRTPRDNSTNVEVVDYYTVHEGKPFSLQFVSNVKDFQRYLPEFEQMVKTFKFVKQTK